MSGYAFGFDMSTGGFVGWSSEQRLDCCINRTRILAPAGVRVFNDSVDGMDCLRVYSTATPNKMITFASISTNFFPSPLDRLTDPQGNSLLVAAIHHSSRFRTQIAILPCTMPTRLQFSTMISDPKPRLLPDSSLCIQTTPTSLLSSPISYPSRLRPHFTVPPNSPSPNPRISQQPSSSSPQEKPICR